MSEGVLRSSLERKVPSFQEKKKPPQANADSSTAAAAAAAATESEKPSAASPSPAPDDARSTGSHPPSRRESVDSRGRDESPAGSRPETPSVPEEPELDTSRPVVLKPMAAADVVRRFMDAGTAQSVAACDELMAAAGGKLRPGAADEEPPADDTTFAELMSETHDLPMLIVVVRISSCCPSSSLRSC